MRSRVLAQDSDRHQPALCFSESLRFSFCCGRRCASAIGRAVQRHREAFIRLKNSPLCHGMAGRGVLLQFLCVNALSGLISFLRSTERWLRRTYGCQCPKRADFISTRPSSILTPKDVCQCPKRADFISTKRVESNLRL